MLLTIPYPNIDPNLIEIGWFVIRWYSLAYIAGLALGWLYCRRLVARSPALADPPPLAGADAEETPEERRKALFDDFFVWAILGVILGGRLGSVLFYNLDSYLADPISVLYLWRGGMSFHGGMLGVLVAMILFTRRRGIGLVAFADLICAAAPIGLFFGRIANFINGELYGRPSNVAWSMVFPADPYQVPRHPSQLYEAALEGLVLFLVLYVLARAGGLARTGLISGVFLTGYSLARTIVEQFREPDAHIGFLVGGATMGQLLSAPMLLGGLFLIAWSLTRPRSPQRP